MGGGLRVIVLNPKFKFVWFYQGFFGFGIGIPISIFCLIFWRTQIWNLVIQNEDCKVLSEQVCIEVPKQICRSQPQKSCCPSNKQQCIKETSALVAWFWWWLWFSFIDPPSQPCLGDSIVYLSFADVTFSFQNGTEKGPRGYFLGPLWSTLGSNGGCNCNCNNTVWFEMVQCSSSTSDIERCSGSAQAQSVHICSERHFLR